MTLSAGSGCVKSVWYSAQCYKRTRVGKLTRKGRFRGEDWWESLSRGRETKVTHNHGMRARCASSARLRSRRRGLQANKHLLRVDVSQGQ